MKTKITLVGGPTVAAHTESWLSSKNNPYHKRLTNALAQESLANAKVNARQHCVVQSH